MSNIAELQSVPEVSFIEGLSLEEVRDQILEDYTSKYQEITGEGVTLAPADPVRLVLLTFAQQFYQGLQFIDWAGKKNLLKYAHGEWLDNLAANKGVIRKSAEYATTTLRFGIQNARTSATSIPAGTRASNLAGVYFMTTQYGEIPAGSTSVDIPAAALEAGEVANGMPAGAINHIVDPLPYISTVSNVTITAGGAAQESDDDLTERVFMFPSSYSTAGAEAAYIYWGKQFRADVADVKAYSPEAGKVTVMFLLDGGVLPSQADIDSMAAFLSPTDKRPLTDQVTVSAPAEVTYNIALTYYIDASKAAEAVTIQAAVNNAIVNYKAWQRAIGKDIEPSELVRRIMNAGAKRVALTAPAYTKIDAVSIAKLGTETVTYGGLEEG